MKTSHIIRKAGKEEDYVEERLTILRMEKLHQLTEYWNQMEENGNLEQIWHQQHQGCEASSGCAPKICKPYRACDRERQDLAG